MVARIVQSVDVQVFGAGGDDAISLTSAPLYSGLRLWSFPWLSFVTIIFCLLSESLIRYFIGISAATNTKRHTLLHSTAQLILSQFFHLKKIFWLDGIFLMSLCIQRGSSYYWVGRSRSQGARKARTVREGFLVADLHRRTGCRVAMSTSLINLSISFSSETELHRNTAVFEVFVTVFASERCTSRLWTFDKLCFSLEITLTPLFFNGSWLHCGRWCSSTKKEF